MREQPGPIATATGSIPRSVPARWGLKPSMRAQARALRLAQAQACAGRRRRGCAGCPASNSRSDSARPAQVLQFVHGVAAQLGEAGDRPETALQLFLAGAQSASEVARLELIAYEFFEQARGGGPRCRR
jgi:hypothetical protein